MTHRPTSSRPGPPRPSIRWLLLLSLLSAFGLESWIPFRLSRSGPRFPDFHPRRWLPTTITSHQSLLVGGAWSGTGDWRDGRGGAGARARTTQRRCVVDCVVHKLEPKLKRPGARSPD